MAAGSRGDSKERRPEARPAEWRPAPMLGEPGGQPGPEGRAAGRLLLGCGGHRRWAGEGSCGHLPSPK